MLRSAAGSVGEVGGSAAGEVAGSAETEVAGLAAGEIVLIVGPEGGISPRESAELTAAGAIPARLGPSVLRGSTAGAVAGALVLSGCGRWI